MTDVQQFSTREVPWMKLGKLVTEAPTAAEAAKLGGIDFDVKPITISYKFGDKHHSIKTKRALVNEDTGELLGIVSTNGVNDHLKALEKKGYIRRADLKSRAIRVLALPDPPTAQERAS